MRLILVRDDEDDEDAPHAKITELICESAQRAQSSIFVIDMFAPVWCVS